MKHKAELTSIKKGDYLELKYHDMILVRVLNIQQHHAFIGESKIQMKLISPSIIVTDGGHITWDFEYLAPLLTRIIQSPTEKRLIRLLYD